MNCSITQPRRLFIFIILVSIGITLGIAGDLPEGWFKAGITCVGMGSNLILKDRVADGDFQSITTKVLKVINWIAEIRQKMKAKK